MKPITDIQQNGQDEKENIPADVFVGKPLIVSSAIANDYVEGCPFECGHDCNDCSSDCNDR